MDRADCTIEVLKNATAKITVKVRHLPTGIGAIVSGIGQKDTIDRALQLLERTIESYESAKSGGMHTNT